MHDELMLCVLAQGDSMTRSELDDLRAHVSEALRIGMPGSPVYQFNAEDLTSTGATSLPPVEK